MELTNENVKSSFSGPILTLDESNKDVIEKKPIFSIHKKTVEGSLDENSTFHLEIRIHSDFPGETEKREDSETED